MAYNEEDCIADAVTLLLRAGHDEVHVFDHGSTDDTANICYRIRRRDDHLHYHHVSRSEVPPADSNGRQSRGIWERIGAFIRGRAERFDWVTWMAADEIIRQPDGELMTKAAIEAEISRGVEVIRPLIRCFWITRGDRPAERAHLERLRHYRPNALGHAPRCWQIDLTPEPIPIGLHVQDRRAGQKIHPWYGYWPAGTAISNNKWLLDHYPIRTIEQGRRKIMREREWISPAGRRPYQLFRRHRCSDLIRGRNKYVRENRELPLPQDRVAS